MTKFIGWAGLFLGSYLAGYFAVNPWRAPEGYILLFIKAYIAGMLMLIVLANLPRLIKWGKQGWDEAVRHTTQGEVASFNGGMQLSFVSAGATGATEKNALRLLPDVKTKWEPVLRCDTADKPAALKAVVLVEVPATNWRRHPGRGIKKTTEIKPLTIVKPVAAETTAKLERERTAKLEQERAAKLEQERAAKLEQERAAKLAQERAAKLERERAAKLERERVAKLEQERAAKLEQERAAKLERERAAKLEQEKNMELKLRRSTSCHLRCSKPGGLVQGPILAAYCKWICKNAAKR